ncbi:hypothetical protein RFI_36396 [Reticulomyxa filosa]|uniref:Uncharacterized protein n=1 Tax=Reticulomyxa filosa TaxID=46433 RepID=X6LHG3_RETFI|nr:hypothetical protein RFI_36396 [Reticulomyxa filosa]|eukprot:ETO01044.1 hypothetical protein RFI_36396 [Reticulomyxa filosa]
MPDNVKAWQPNLEATTKFDTVIEPTKELSSEEEVEVRATKLSETVKAFLLRKCHEIALHALAVFHPLSKGNVYHGRVVLEVLLAHWPKSFIAKLVNEKDLQSLPFTYIYFVQKN